MKRTIMQLVIFLICCTGCAMANPQAVLGEAEGEPYIGKIAVACGILNRPEGIGGVLGYHSKRAGWVIPQWAIDDSNLAWRAAQINPKRCFRLIRGADMWCSNIEQCRVAWRGVPMHYITKIGNHHFYRRITTKKGE